MRLAVIVPAGGASTRYLAGGALRHKLDEDLGGKPVLQRTVEIFTKYEGDDGLVIRPILVAGPYNDDAFAEFSRNHRDRLSLMGATLCKGGESHRWETVAAALALIPATGPDAPTHIAIHDAARPCLSHELLGRLVRAAAMYGAVVPAVVVSDTLKRVREIDAPAKAHDPFAAIFGEAPAPGARDRVVESTLAREDLVLVQTPQIFEAGLLRRAYAALPALAAKGVPITDDSRLIEALGETVHVIEGDPRNIKITQPADTELARRILDLRETQGRSIHKRF